MPKSKSLNQPLRLGIVGAGKITASAHLPAALRSSEVRLEAIVDSATERAKQLAADNGISPRIAGDVREILDYVDGVVVATPNDTHRPVAISCLNAGVPVLIDKPLASTVKEGQEIVDTATAKSVKVSVGYCTRFRTNVMLLRRLLEDNQFGAVHRFAYQAGSVGGWTPLSDYHLHLESSGGGVLIVTGSHFLDRILFLWGFPDRLSYADDSQGGPEANCTAMFDYSAAGQPMRGIAMFSKTVSLPARLILDTEAGIVILPDTDDGVIVLKPKGHPHLEQVFRSPYSIAVTGDKTVFQLQIEDFASAVRNGHEPRVTAIQGLESLKLIEALYSCRTDLATTWYDKN